MIVATSKHPAWLCYDRLYDEWWPSYSSWGSAYTVVDKPYFVCLILQPSNVLLDSECFVKVSHCCFSTLILFK